MATSPPAVRCTSNSICSDVRVGMAATMLAYYNYSFFSKKKIIFVSFEKKQKKKVGNIMSKNGSGDSSKSPMSKTGTLKNPSTPGVIPVAANSNDSAADLDPKLQEMLANLPAPGDVHSTEKLYIMNPMLSLPEIGQQMQDGIM